MPSVPLPSVGPNPDLPPFDASELVNRLSEAELQEVHADLRCAAIKEPEVYAKLFLELSKAIKAQYGSSPEGFDLDESTKALPCDSKPKTCGGALREVLPALDFLCTVTDEETAKAYPLTSDASMALAAGTGQARDGSRVQARKHVDRPD